MNTVNTCNETTAAATVWSDLVVERTFTICASYNSHQAFCIRTDQARRRAIRSHGIRR